MENDGCAFALGYRTNDVRALFETVQSAKSLQANVLGRTISNPDWSYEFNQKQHSSLTKKPAIVAI